MNYRAAVLCLLMTTTMSATALAKDSRAYTDKFGIESCTFKSTGRNPHFILQPGRQLNFSNANCVARGKCKELETLVITTLFEERDITFTTANGTAMTVRARVVEEREMANGSLKEISRNYFAECDGTRDVFYFGEDVDIYENGVIANHDGAWLAGVNGAQPGIIMPGGAFLLGARYFQEIAPTVAMDRAEHMAMGLNITVPAGAYQGCVRIHESSPLDRKIISKKAYCPGTGLVIDGDSELLFVVE